MSETKEEGLPCICSSSWQRRGESNTRFLQCAEKAPCPRCKRLGISCVGLGQQRYKFLNEGSNPTTASDITSVTNVAKLRKRAPPLLPTYSPTNETTRLTSAFIDRINIFVDIRFQLLGNFGVYLADVPCRLGTNSALDAASEALVATHTWFCAGRLNPDRAVLAKYSHALFILRHDLDCSVKAHSSETLCAIMMVMIIQVSNSISSRKSNLI